MRVIGLFGLVALCLVGAFVVLNTTDIMQWAVAQQRAFQNEMADSVFGLKSGSPGAWAALLTATAAYGFVHALGPGHGKYLIGGVGLGSSISVSKLTGLALASSLAQALWAIVLVYGGFFLLEVSADRITGFTEAYLAPASYAAIGVIGLVLVGRGVGQLARRKQETHTHDAHCGCHGHGPTVEEATQVGSIRDAIVLIGSIAVRPCTGAIFLLVIAWQMDIRLAGAAAVITMGLGTAGLTGLVAVSSVASRSLAAVSSEHVVGAEIAFPALQIVAGTAILWGSLILLGITL